MKFLIKFLSFYIYIFFSAIELNENYDYEYIRILKYNFYRMSELYFFFLIHECQVLGWKVLEESVR